MRGVSHSSNHVLKLLLCSLYPWTISGQTARWAYQPTVWRMEEIGLGNVGYLHFCSNGLQCCNATACCISHLIVDVLKICVDMRYELHGCMYSYAGTRDACVIATSMKRDFSL